MKRVSCFARKAVPVAVEVFSIRRALESFMRQALRAQSAFLVRGSSRRIMSMRFRPANIRVINRRADRLGRHSRCFPLAREKQRRAAPRNCCLTRSAISEVEFQRKLNIPRVIESAHGIDYAEGAVVDVGIRSAKLRMVEGVEHLHAELKIELVLRSEVVVLEEGNVPVVDAGIVNGVESP